MRRAIRSLRGTVLGLALVVAALGLASTTVQAMGQGMYTLKYVDGPNLILVTPNVDETESGTPIQYNLRLYDEHGKPVPFSNVRATIMAGTKETFSQNLRRSANNDTTLYYTYPKQGTYTIKAVFMENGKQVAKSEFPITVAKGKNQGFWITAFTMQTLLAFVLGIVLGILGIKRHAIAIWIKTELRARRHSKTSSR